MVKYIDTDIQQVSINELTASHKALASILSAVPNTTDIDDYDLHQAFYDIFTIAERQFGRVNTELERRRKVNIDLMSNTHQC